MLTASSQTTRDSSFNRKALDTQPFLALLISAVACHEALCHILTIMHDNGRRIAMSIAPSQTVISSDSAQDRDGNPLGLPPELRNRVYESLFASGSMVDICDKRMQQWQGSNRALTQVNRKLRKECLPLYYSSHIFRFKSYTHLNAWFHDLGDYCCFLRRLVLHDLDFGKPDCSNDRVHTARFCTLHLDLGNAKVYKDLDEDEHAFDECPGKAVIWPLDYTYRHRDNHRPWQSMAVDAEWALEHVAEVVRKAGGRWLTVSK